MKETLIACQTLPRKVVPEFATRSFISDLVYSPSRVEYMAYDHSGCHMYALHSPISLLASNSSMHTLASSNGTPAVAYLDLV